MARLHLLSSVLLAVTQTAFCVLYTDPSDLPNTKYDFIVVGGGTGGNIIATRLSENPYVSVLVIEAGPLPDVEPRDEVPFYANVISPNTSVTWNYTTSPQAALNNRTIPYPTGRVLGGSSTINYLMWTRGSEDDYNRYAEFTGDDGWSFDNIMNYFKRSEHLIAPTDGHNTTGEVNPAVHGYGGPVQIGLSGAPEPTDQMFFVSTQEFPDVFPYNLDMNSGKPLGLGWTQNDVDAQGRRSSSAAAYLEPVSNRTNLDVLIETTATKLIPAGYQNGLPVFTSVEVSQGTGEPSRVFSARKEIIVSAGAIGTPHLLLLSGIGDPKELHKFGIESTVDLPAVGQYLADHPLVTIQWLVNANQTLETIERNATLLAYFLEEWNTTGTGPFTGFGVNEIAWLRMPANSSVYETGDPSAGPNSAHIELLPGNGYISFTGGPTPSTGNYLSVVIAAVSPSARGSVTLASANPFVLPIINPNLLGTDDDVAFMVQGIKYAQQLVSNTAFDGYIISAVNPSPNATTDSALETFLREQATTIYHPVGTARMGNESSSSVTTPQLLVRGTVGLRIVDASIVPYIPSAHPQAVVYGISERAADLIKATWSLF